MGNFLSGVQARLIFTGGASSAACLVTSDIGHVNDEAVLFSKEGGHAF
jgi:hypothetical protein